MFGVRVIGQAWSWHDSAPSQSVPTASPSLSEPVHHLTTPRVLSITAERYESAPVFSDYLSAVVNNKDWWMSAYKTASVSTAHVERARALGMPWRLLALSEDWCGDAVNILPYVARLVDSAPEALELRVLERDANPDLMDAHLTGRSRSIPLIMALDANFVERGWWGPRPSDLQKQAMGEWWTLPKDERRLRLRSWYARDRGRQILEEILLLLEAAGPRG